MKSIEDLIIKEQDFANDVKGKILPLLKEKTKDGYIENKNGLKLHYQFLINPQEKASIVISHGYCEFIPKYTEVIYYFYNMGYSVFIMEHQGHGFSDRLVTGYSKVYVKHFEDYVQDFHLFIEKVVIPESLTEHLYLFAHSMGGGIGALYLEEHPEIFEKAVLTSPMIKLSTGTISNLVIRLVCVVSYIPFLAQKYLPGHHDYDHSYKYPHCSTISKARYNFIFDEREREPHYRSNGASLSWAREAFNVSKKILKNAHLVKIPVILMQASLDTLVMPEEQVEFCRRAANCQLRRFEDSKHEIFNASDDIIQEYYSEVFEFYEK
ncbi:alpha/beta fold hydrolase [Pseudobutyrivibrio xylanivorans]|uniref:Lysophospholipase n=1 Tax=Pseudobutyrivibrio xylanivorans TaxID=185007 RepID=A0A5P6VSG4_PSEXY|nr:alpha/beta fold hydrolase [Pseudobutyrivibrio xylanivorans]QFJ53791.1 lysophospholipase [Pseudobutyrivibrio xylanivorans]